MTAYGGAEMCVMSQIAGAAFRPKWPILYTGTHRAPGQEGTGAGLTADISYYPISSRKQQV